MKVDLDTLLLSLQGVGITLWFKEMRAARMRVRQLDEIAGEFRATMRIAEMMQRKLPRDDG